MLKWTRAWSVQVNGAGLFTVMSLELMKMGPIRCLATWMGLFTHWMSLMFDRFSMRLIVLGSERSSSWWSPRMMKALESSTRGVMKSVIVLKELGSSLGVGEMRVRPRVWWCVL